MLVRKVNKIFALESLRGIAALCVALYHYPSSSFLYFKHGHTAVYFFFVLSGFVITLNYIDRINNFKDLINFQIKRFYRLYPTHIFILFIVLFVQILKYLVVNYTQMQSGQAPFSHLYTLKDFIANLLLIQSIFNYFYYLSWNGAAWSISTEFYTYVIFGALFMVSKKSLIPLIIFIYLVIKIFKFTIFSYFENFYSIFNTFFFTCIYYFSIGSFSYHIYKYFLNKFFINNFFSIIFVILLFLLKLFEENIFLQYQEIIYVLIILTTIFLKKNTYVYKFLNSKLLIFLGTISYSFYLIHQTVIYLFIQFCKFILKVKFVVDVKSGSVGATGNVYYDTAIHLSYISLAILAGYFIYKHIEMPFRKK